MKITPGKCPFSPIVTGSLVALLLNPVMAFAVESGSKVQNEMSAVFAGIGFLALVSLSVIGGLAYLWYRHSKYKKQKVILDV